jgi:cation transport ATPase
MSIREVSFYPEAQGLLCLLLLLQALADVIASWFVPVVCVIAAATFATWLGLGLTGRLDLDKLPAGTTPLLLALLSAGMLGPSFARLASMPVFFCCMACAY